MTPTARGVPQWLCLAVVVALFAGPAAPWAWSQPLPEADFFFARPRASIGLRGGLVFPRERSDLFDFLQEQLTIERGDFRSAALAADLNFVVTDRLDVVAGFEFTRKSLPSEYRELVDNNFLPIEQQTQLSQRSATASLRVALTPVGQRAGSFAWVPSRVVPYVGVGGGVLWWRFLQFGDFVDFQDLGVFTDTFESTGVSPTGHVFGGADVQLYKRLFLTLEGRYVWASGTLDRDFIGFDPVDLSGLRTAAGIRLVF